MRKFFNIYMLFKLKLFIQLGLCCYQLLVLYHPDPSLSILQNIAPLKNIHVRVHHLSRGLHLHKSEKIYCQYILYCMYFQYCFYLISK